MPYTLRQQEYIDSVEGEAHMSAVEIIGELELALNAGREWHLVLHALPGPDHGWVLVAVNPKSRHSRPYVTIGAYSDSERGWRDKWGNSFDGQVVRWMQLPAYPTGDPPTTHCRWQQTSDTYDPPWRGECGILWQFDDGDPADNLINYCPRCGRPVSVVEGQA